MKRSLRALLAAVAVAAIGTATPAFADQTLVDVGNLDLAKVQTQDAKVSRPAGRATLQIATGTKQKWPGVTFPLPQPRDLSAFARVEVAVKNADKQAANVTCRVDSRDDDGKLVFIQEGQQVEPGQTKTVSVTLKQRMTPALEKQFFGMRGNPGGVEPGKGIDLKRVAQVLVFVGSPSAEHTLEIGPIRAAGVAENAAFLSLDPNKIFPLVDRFGQFIHKQWPGKIESEADLQKRKAEEAAELAAQTEPEGWTQYGGWKSGPTLKATGFFRVEKHNGKWWLVDPEGRLFWSHGVDCVRATSDTPITDRKHYFAELPKPGSPMAVFYGKRGFAPHGYYQDKSSETFNIYGANLLRKYGDDWQTQFTDAAHRRLRSWGLNTIGNWSGPEIYLAKRTPYVATIRSGNKVIEGSSGYWGKFPDPFDPDFRRSLERNMAAERGKSAGDPWCIGYFVDNEIAWGDEYSLAEAALMSPPEQACKKALVDELKAKYATVEKLNAAWGTKHASWDALLASREKPDRQKAGDDLTAFYTKIAEQYFRVCRDAVKEAAPGQLYLGCRFAWRNDRAVRAAAAFADTVSFNVYKRTLSDLRLPEGVDKPIIIGEFHFGALDRGMFHTGLVKTGSQEERAAAYRDYVRSGLAHPQVVGTHWFQFVDQATTGRFDGENYQIGLVDICDTPYPETIRAVREIGRTMYEFRTQGK